MARHSGLDWASSGADVMNIAGVARALVKKMIPNVAEGNNAEELLLANFDYAQLDKPGNAARIRLNSTVVNVEHAGAPDDADEVFVNDIRDNKSCQVQAKAVVMACYNMIIPHIVTGLPEEQSAALKLQGKSPLQYTTVGLRNWQRRVRIDRGEKGTKQRSNTSALDAKQRLFVLYAGFVFLWIHREARYWWTTQYLSKATLRTARFVVGRLC